MSNWPLVPLRRVANIVNGGTPTSDGRNWDGRVPWATPVDLASVDGGHLSATLRLLTEEGLRTGSRTVPTGSLIISTRAPIGYVAQVNQVTAFNQGCRGLVPQDSCDGRFLQYALISQTDVLQSLGTGSTFLELSTEALANVMVPLPPLEEQRRIANDLDDQTTRIDQAIQLRQKQVQLLGLRQASAFVAVLLGGGKQASKEEGCYVGLPSHWAIRPLRQYWQVIDCKHRTPDYVGVGFPVVSPGDITASDLDLSRCHRFVTEADYRDLADDLRRCRQGDIVYSRNASAGTAAYVATDDPFTMGQDVCRITSTGMGQEYLYFALNNIVGPQLEAVRVGSTITRINIDQIRTLTVPVPPRAEQLTIAAECRTIEREGLALSGQLNDSIELLRNRRIALISEAVGGRHAAPAS